MNFNTWPAQRPRLPKPSLQGLRQKISLLLMFATFISLGETVILRSVYAGDESITEEVTETEVDADTLRDFIESGSNIDLRGINGGKANDQIFIHTFNHIQSKNPKERVCGAKLATHLVASTDSLTYTDTLGMRFYQPNSYRAVETWGHPLGETFSGGKPGEWWDLDHFPNGFVHQLNLAKLPLENASAKANVISTLATCDRFAFYVEDDTYVRSLALKLDYCIDGTKTRSRIIRVRPPKGHEDPAERAAMIDEANPFEVKRATVSVSAASANESIRQKDGVSSSVGTPGANARADVTLSQLKDNGDERHIRIMGEYGAVKDRSTGLFDFSFHENPLLFGGLFSSSPAYTLLQARVGIEFLSKSSSYALVAIPAQLVYENRGFDGARGSGLQSLQHGIGIEASQTIGQWFTVFGGVLGTVGVIQPSQHSYFMGPINSPAIVFSADGRPYFFRSQLGFEINLNESISVNGSISHERLGVSGTQNGRSTQFSTSQTQLRVGTSVRIK